MVAISFIVAAFMVPPRCGRYAVDAFFTIIWLGLTAFMVSRMLKAQPRRPTWSFALLGILLALWAYPLCGGWWTQEFGPDGALSFLAGSVLFLVFAIAERRLIFPTLFGSDRSIRTKEWQEIRAAQAAVRTERADRMASLTDARRREK